MKFMQKFWRGTGLYLIPVVVIGWLFYTDPDQGKTTQDMLQGAATAVIAITLMHLARKFVLPYVKLEEFAKAALKSGTGAGLVFMGVMIFMAALLLMFAPRAHAQDSRTFVPPGAYRHAPALKSEQMRLWPSHPAPAMLGALVELESCISLRHSRCWNPASKLKTSREEGAGFGQITRAYRSDGSIRFDALEATKQLDPSLADWSWSNVYQRPDLQLRALVVMNRDCDRRLVRLVADPSSRIGLCDAAYNGGYAGMQAERRACGRRTGCDPQKWFGHVEHVCLKSKVKMTGYGRSPCEINREHVREVTLVRWAKYIPLMGAT